MIVNNGFYVKGFFKIFLLIFDLCIFNIYVKSIFLEYFEYNL